MSQENEDSRQVSIEPFPRKWLIGLAVASVLFLLAELSYTKHHAHVHYEEWYGFFSMSAIGAMLILCGASQLVRPLLSRGGDYYDG